MNLNLTIRKPYIGHVYLGFYWLAMSNTCVNPVIYYVMNRRFRAYFNQVLCCVPSCLARTAKTHWTGTSQHAAQVTLILSYLILASQHEVTL